MNVFIRRPICLFALAALPVVCGCTADGGRMHRRLRTLAGPGAIDCGDSLFAHLIPKNNACAIGASVEHAPFYVRWEIPDGNSTSLRGIALTNLGQMFIVTEDLKDPAHEIAMTPCSTPQLVPDPAITSMKVLTCVPDISSPAISPPARSPAKAID